MTIKSLMQTRLPEVAFAIFCLFCAGYQLIPPDPRPDYAALSVAGGILAWVTWYRYGQDHGKNRTTQILMGVWVVFAVFLVLRAMYAQTSYHP